MFTRGSVVMLSIFLSGCAGSTVFNQQQPFVRSSDSYSSTLAKGADVGQTTGLLFFLNMQAGDLFRIRLPQDDDFRRRTFGLQNGEGLAIDRQGHLFESAGNGGPNTVTVFNRKLETIRTITIKPPDGIGAIAVDGDGLLYAYVNDTKHAVIQVFSKTASGMAKPRRKIAGNQTGLAPYALCIDAAGELIVAGEGSIEFFAPGAKGNVPPVRVLKRSI
jgi:sugar lactone lactonase YvrE